MRIYHTILYVFQTSVGSQNSTMKKGETICRTERASFYVSNKSSIVSRRQKKAKMRDNLLTIIDIFEKRSYDIVITLRKYEIVKRVRTVTVLKKDGET